MREVFGNVGWIVGVIVVVLATVLVLQKIGWIG
jgi:hypothetical protein